MTEQQRDQWLEERLPFWQNLLRLGDWKITAYFVPQVELGEGISASMTADSHTHKALIRLMNPKDEPQLRSAPTFQYDPEHSLLHELVHIRLLEAEFERLNDEEFAVNAIADALVALAKTDEPSTP